MHLDPSPLSPCSTFALASRGRAGRPEGRRWLLIAGLALCAPLLFGIPEEAGAQEIRIGVGGVAADVDRVPSARGYGFGARWISSRAIGVGIQYDRYEGSRRFPAAFCDLPGDPPGEDCSIDSTLDLMVFEVVIELADSEDWKVRASAGRTAGRMVGIGRGVETGTTFEPYPADTGASYFAWSRGVDGSVFSIEVLRSLPLEYPVHLSATFRNHLVDMTGCGDVVAVIPYYCGDANLTELQLGMRVGLRGWRNEG
jgi:hypothetical protein